MIVASSNNFLLTLQDILNPVLRFIFGKMQVINNIPDIRVSYYCDRTLVHLKCYFPENGMWCHITDEVT